MLKRSFDELQDILNKSEQAIEKCKEALNKRTDSLNAIESSNCIIDLDKISIDVLCLTIRTSNCLKNSNLNTIGDIIRYTDYGNRKSRLLMLKALGRISYSEVLEEMRVFYKIYEAILP